MSNVLHWLLILVLFLALTAFVLWRRTRRASGFQARLALLFFLFVVIPVIPLAIFTGQILIKGSQGLQIPGVEEALSGSLDYIRSQLNQTGQNALQTRTLEDFSKADSLPGNLVYVGRLQFENGSKRIDSLTLAPEWREMPHRHFQNLEPEDMQSRLEFGEILRIEDVEIFESYLPGADSGYLFAGQKIPADILQTKEQINEGMRNYSSLLLIREALVEGNSIWMIIFMFVIILAAISIWISRAFSSGISEPIRALTTGMKNVADGDLSYRVPIKAKDEIAFLVDSFNMMTQELQINRENLHRAERAAAWRDVARQISHEIKNPLTPIEFSLYRLEQTLPEEWNEHEDIKEPLRIIKEEIASIRRITSEFSRFARMPQMELKPTDIGAVIKDSVQLFNQNQAEIPITLKIDDNLPDVNLDEEHFRRVMHNILKNAREATSPGDSITVSVATDEKHKVRIHVEDTGSGMDAATLERLFEPYFTTKNSGSGIGMFLVNRIVQDHGGNIDVQSEKGQGTTVTIRI